MAGGRRIASLFAEIGADTSDLKRGLADTKSQLQGTGKDMVAFGGAARSAFSQVATAAFVATAAIAGIKKGYQIAREGADLSVQVTQFERLTASIGSTSDAMLNQLKAATRGTRSELELMAGAAQILGLGLVTTEEQTVRLTRVMGALNQDINEVVLTLANQSTRRFDQLNVSVRGFEQRLESLKATGLSTEDAFTEAFLQQAERQIEITGDVAETAAGQFLRLEAAIKDTSDAYKLAAGEGLAPFIKSALDTREAQDLVWRALRDGVIAFDEFNDGVSRTSTSFVVHEELLGLIAERYAEMEAGLQAINDAAASWDAKFLAAPLEAGAAAAFDMKQALSDLQMFVAGPVGAAFENFQAQQLDLAQRAAYLRDQIAFLETMPQTGQGQAELLGLRAEMENVRQQIIANSEAFDEQTRRMIFDLAIQRLSIAELPEAMRSAAFQMLNDIALAWGLVDQQTHDMVTRIDTAFAQLAQGNVKAAQQEILNIGNAALAVQGDYYIRFHVQVTGTGVGVGGQLIPDPKDVTGGRGAADDFINTTIPPGTSGFKPPSFGGFGGGSFGGGGSFKPPKFNPPKFNAAPSAITTIEETLGQKLSPFLQAARAVSNIADMFADKLQAQADAFQQLYNVSFIDATLRSEKDREAIQKRMVAHQEKLLALQKAQQRLAFLEQQIRLLDLIEQSGLDAGAILQGLKLGVDADAAEMVEAMTRALNALIQQTETKLEIGSPSKLMERYGKFWIQGLAVGAMKEMRTLDRVADSTLGALDVTSEFRGIGIGRSRQESRGIVINVHPSEGMDETDLARKVGEVLQRKLFI